MASPQYVAEASSEEDCSLLCEADVRCRYSTFDDGGACTVVGHEEADGTPATEGAAQPTYQLPGDPRPPATEQKRPYVLLATFANGARFEETQQLLEDSLELAEIDDHWRWNSSSFEHGEHGRWYERHKKTNFRRGGAWKPYIIWQAFRHVQWGEWVVYHDASQYIQEGFSSSIRPLLGWLEDSREINPCQCIAAVRLRQTLQHEYQQQCISEYGPEPRASERAFELFCGLQWRLGTCTASSMSGCCERIWRQPTMQHAWSFWRKNRQSARFLREWAKTSEDYDVVAHLPFVDQSLNSLLMHRWHAQLGVRALWVPALYRMAWEQDADITGTFGRNSADVFKHANFVLDTLHNQAITGQQLMSLVDLDADLSDVVDGRQMQWSEASASPHAWRRSLCLQSPSRPALAATSVFAQLFLKHAGSARATPWSGRYKNPSGWDSLVYDAPHSLASSRSGGLRAALTAPPRGEVAELALGGLETLHAHGLSGALSLGSWRPSLFGRHHHAVSAPLQVVAEVRLLNDGKEAWPAGSKICRPSGALAGNSSLAASASSALCGQERGFETFCSEVAPGDSVLLVLSVQLPARDPDATGETAWQDERWALCSPVDGKPFGVLMRALIRFDSK